MRHFKTKAKAQDYLYNLGYWPVRSSNRFCRDWENNRTGRSAELTEYHNETAVAFSSTKGK